jgi:phosphocarrier protein
MSQTAQITLTLSNKKGLHARASNKFMQTVLQFESQVWVRSHNDVCADRVEANSVLDLLLLGAACTEDITVTAQGSDAPLAIEAIAALVNNRFGEED